MDPKQKNEDELDIEIVDDVPEEQKPKTTAAEKPAPTDEGADDSDMSQYSEAVQKRIKRLTFARREEERLRAEAQRMREEAVRYAETVARENAELKQRLTAGQTTAVNATKAQLEAQLASVKASFKAAYEAGDADGVAEAQVKIAELTAQKSRVDEYLQQAARQPAQQPVQQPVQPRLPQVPPPDAMAQEWARKNPWFGQDKAMTGFAYGMHETLVTRGVDPRTQTYYDEIDKAVRERFPDAFDTPGEDVIVQPRSKGTVVAPTSRDVKAPRTVRLTQTQIALASRLGLTPQQYAAQLIKDRTNG